MAHQEPSGYIETEDELTEEQAAELARIWTECITAEAIPLHRIAHVYRDLPRSTRPKDQP